MAKPSGEIIETPITANFREGLNVLQYFISTHGARKGLADTALKTADSGYLTRRLVDVAQDVIITEFDCGTTDGIFVGADRGIGRNDRASARPHRGPRALEDQRDYEGNMIVDVNQEINEDLAAAIQAAGIERVKIRSVLTCESKRGVCVRATAATWRPAGWWSGAKRWASLRRSPSANPAPSSPCVPSTSAERRAGFREQSTQDAKSDGFINSTSRSFATKRAN